MIDQHPDVVAAAESEVDLPELENDGAAADARSDLFQTALLVETKLTGKACVSFEELGKQMGIQRKAMQDRLYAVAEKADQHQRHMFTALVDYTRRLAAGEGCQQIAFVEHIVYDETPLKASLRLPGGRHTEISKLFVVDIGWKILIRLNPIGSVSEVQRLTPENQVPIKLRSEDYLLLTAQYSLALRTGEGTSGEAVRPVLASCPVPPDAVTKFLFHTRLCESDEAGGNKRAEEMVRQSRPSTWKTLPSFCLAHKIHNAAERTWAACGHQDIIAGLIHVALFLQEAGTTKQFRLALRRVLERRDLTITFNPCPPASKKWREHLLSLFGPSPSKHANTHALAKTVCDHLLNGDWSSPTLCHHCRPGCCDDGAHTRKKLVEYVPKLLVSLPTVIWQRGDWANWRRAAWQSGLFQGMHGLWAETFKEAFASKLPAQLPHEIEAEHREEEAAEPPLGPANDEHARDSEQFRLQRLKYQQAALAFLNEPLWHARLLILLQSLVPQMRLMDSILQGSSMATEHQRQLSGDPDDRYRVLQWHLQVPQHRYLGDALQNLKTWPLWGLDVAGNTEALRTSVFVTSMRGPATVYQNISVPLKGYPWRLFSLISDPSEANATSMLDSPACMLDQWSKDVLEKYATVPQLVSDSDLRQMLTCLASTILHTTFSAERAHAQNARRSRGGGQTWVKTIESLALHHVAWAGEKWLRPLSRKDHKSAPRGRPRKRAKEAASSHEAVPAKKQRTGGGGAWRAFVHHQTTHFKQAVDFSALREAYVALEPAEKEFYRELGRSG